MHDFGVIGFSDMPDLMVWSEMTLNCGQNPKWPPFAEGSIVNLYNFRHNKGIFMFWCLSWGFMYAQHRGAVKIQDEKYKMVAQGQPIN